MPVTLIIFACTILAWVYLRDDALPYDGGLAMPAIDIASPTPRAPDRIKRLLSAIKVEPPGTKNPSTPWDWDTPTLARITNANAFAFDNLKDLLADPHWIPHQQAWFNEDLGSPPDPWNHLGMAKGIACAYYQRVGQDAAAMQSALDLAELSKRLQTISAWPTYYARGVELHQHACVALAVLLRSSNLDTKALTRWQVEWERHTPEDAPLADAFRGFYEFERKLIVGPRAGDPWDALTVQMMPQVPGRLFFKPHRTLDLFAQSFLELKQQVHRPAYLRSTQISERIGPQLRPLANIGSPNYAGTAYAHNRIWPYVNLMERHSLERARHLVVLTLFAVRCWSLDHAKAPAQLADLVPHYFSQLPTDPFSGQPIKYDPTKGLIYSLGFNLQDEHGNPTEIPLEDPQQPTISFR